MRIYRSSAEAAEISSSVVTIGNFDGIHVGHQHLFERTLALAEQEGATPAVLTFDPPPARFFNPEQAPPLIKTEQQKLALMERFGIGAVVIATFDAEFAALSPAAFAERVLVELKVRHVIVGARFVFGHERSGDVQTLQELGARLGFQAHGIEPVRRDVGGESVIVSSTRIRERLLDGDVETAATLLGRPFFVEGEVIRGAGRGRTIGIPTANLKPDNELLPARGVYAGQVRAGGLSRLAVVNIGQAPTLRSDGSTTYEAHLLDYEGDLLGRRIELELSTRLRDERRFGGIEELVSAIRADISRARELL